MAQPHVDLKQITEHALDMARDDVLAGQEVLRVFFAANADGELNIVCAPKEGEEQETQLLKFLGLLFAVWGVTQYAMVSEVWISKRTKYSRENGSMPSEDPNRMEAISAIAVRRVKGESGQSHKITTYATREVTRNPTAVGPIEWPDFDRLEGRMTMLLPPEDLPPCPPNMRELLMEALKHPMFNHRSGLQAANALGGQL